MCLSLECKSSILFDKTSKFNLVLRICIIFAERSGMERCFILFGSNMGDKDALYDKAIHLINIRCGNMVAQSSAYESEPWGFESHEWFLNRLVVVETALSADGLMQELLRIEEELGRERSGGHKGYQSRPIDLDILYYGSRIILTDWVIAPHPRIHLRRFALKPMCEVAPDFVHPVFGLTQQMLLEQCPDHSVVKKK